MPKIPGSTQHAADSSDSEAEDVDGPDIEWVEDPADDPPLKSSQSVSTRLRRTVIDEEDDDDEDEDDEPIVAPSSTKRRRPVINLDSDDDDDDAPIVSRSSPLKRSRPAFVELEDSEDSDVSPAKRRKAQATPGRLKRPTLAASSPVKKTAHKGHRSEKQKKMELLRRRRAGEKIDKLTSSEDDSDDKRGLYDTDPEEDLGVLKEFEDEESEGDADETVHPRRKDKEPTKRSRKISNGEEDDEDDDDLDDFVTDDDDGLIGAPANLDIPLQFTSQAHRPLKDQFPFVIEWLVHHRMNPAFDRNDPVYTNAWRKLDDEVHALASSKFASSAWKVEFHRTLKARPKMEAYEMDSGERRSGFYDSCDACGRSNHPATFRIVFQGQPYHKNTLEEVESSSEDQDSEEDDGDESGHESVDTQGMTLPPVSKEWHVGSVCCSNAETAHSLIHWKHALKEWVEERLQEDGWMKIHELQKRERMKTSKRRKLANDIVDGWRENGIVAALFRDFKSNLEEARNKSTLGRDKGRYRR